MLREITSAASDAACLVDIETPLPREDRATGLWADHAELPPEVRAAAVLRSQRIPGLDAIVQAWAQLPPVTQDQIGVEALALAFYGWLSGDPCAKPADRWLTGDAAGDCDVEANRALNALHAIAGRALPELYGSGEKTPAWAHVDDSDLTPLDMGWEAELPSPVQFAIALHRRAWQTLQASAAFLRAAGKVEERMAVSWPAEEVEDEALTDLLMLPCRDLADAGAMLAHLEWYRGVRHQHPKSPALGEADGALIAVRLRDLSMIAGKEVVGAAPAPEPGGVVGLIAAHRACWSAYLATPNHEATGWDAHFALTEAAGAAVTAVLRAPCADWLEATALIEHVQWYSAELEAAGEELTDGSEFESQQLRARAGDLALFLGDGSVAGLRAGRS
jgi:hypothetical protein